MVCGILERFSDNSRKDRLSVYKEDRVLCMCMHVLLHTHACEQACGNGGECHRVETRDTKFRQDVSEIKQLEMIRV